jgi:predicted DNA-binding transcriptional regulator AlpA
MQPDPSELAAAQIARGDTPAPAPPPRSDDDYLGSVAFRRVLGDISDTTFWRYEHDPRLGFPKPDLIIRRRKFWRRATIARWLATQATKKEAVGNATAAA